MPAPVVALCMPIANKIHPLNFQAYRFLQRQGIGWHHLSVVGQPVDVARNIITNEALTTKDITHLLWIDDDMVYPPEALKRLLAHDCDIVGGLCFDRRHPYKPVIARELHPSWGYDPGALGWIYDYPPDELIDVDFTGGAFLLVKREVFETIRRELGDGNDEWAEWWKPLPEWLSEDLSFCARARKAGFKIKVDTGLKIGHIGECEVNEEFVKRNRHFEYDKWHPPLTDLAAAAAHTNIIEPVASIVITAYNPKPDQLKVAVLSALAQTVKCEVIVVDDGSTEGSFLDTLTACAPLQQKVGHERLRVIRREENRGISAALNTGINIMTTEWFCWLPCDDFYEPDKVERQLTSLLCANRLCGYHGYNITLDNRNAVAHVQTLLFRERAEQNRILAVNCAINGTTVMIHKDVLAAVGPFDETLKYAQDWDMWRRIGLEYDWFGMPDKLATRREFGNLTEMLMKTKNQRKLDEDEIVRSRYGSP